MQIRLALAIAIGCALSTAAIAQDGQLDTRFATSGFQYFAPDGIGARTLGFNAITTLADGSLVSAGFIDRSPPIPLSEPDYRVVVAKMRPDGTPDPTFGNTRALPGVFVFADLKPGARIQEAKSIALDGDGNLVIGGSLDAWEFGGFVLKMSATGALDPDFGDAGISLLPFQVLDIAIDSSQRIVTAGRARGEVPMHHGLVSRLDGSSGALDASFGDDGIASLLEYDDEGGVLDHQGVLTSVDVTDDGRIIAAGSQQQEGVVFAYSLARFTDAGLDPSFAGDGWLKFLPEWSPSSVNNWISDVLVDAEGRIVLAGDFKGESSIAYPLIARFTADGESDVDFGEKDTPGFARIDLGASFGSQSPTALALQNDGSLVFTAATNSDVAQPRYVAARVDVTGKLDQSFGADGVASVPVEPSATFSDGHAITLQAGQPVVAGYSGYISGTGELLIRASVFRLSANPVFFDDFEN